MTMTYCIQEPSKVRASNIQREENSSKFTCLLEKESIPIKVPVGGEHFILNALCAVCVGKVLNIEKEKIQEGIQEFELTKKRMDISILENGIEIINDAYNASLESMKASLNYLAQYKKGRKIAVLGDMLELGEYTEQIHCEVGKEVYKNQISQLVIKGENAKYIAKQAEKEGMAKENIYEGKTKEEIIHILKKIAKPNDIILCKASNSMKFFEIAEELKKVL